MATKLPIKTKMIPSWNPNYPQALINDNSPLWITIHETGNTRVGADAAMHATFLYQGGGTSNVAFHLTVDRHEAWQMMKFNRIGWHASDGCDDRNRDLGCFASIAIETCVDSNNAFKNETRANLVKLIAMILSGDPALDFGGVDPKRFSVDRIATHHKWAYDGKWCPTYMLNDGYVETIPDRVRAEMGSAAVVPPSPAPKYPAPLQIPALDKLARGSADTMPAYVDFAPGYRAYWVGDRVRAKVAQKRLRNYDGSEKEVIGPWIEPGTEFDVDWLIVNRKESTYADMYRTPWGTFVWAQNMERIRDTKAA